MKSLMHSTLLSFVLLCFSCVQTNESDSSRAIEQKKSETDQALLLNGTWIQPNPINENEVQGFVLHENGDASSVNMATLVYKKWWTEDKNLLVVAESIGNGTSSKDTTTYEIINITENKLELRIGENMDTYTRK